MTHLDHDHREGENVCFLAIIPLPQDLWRGPSRGVAVVTRGGPHGVQVLSDRGEAEIRNSRMTRAVHKDIWLAGCQYSSEARSRSATYSLEIPMNHVAGVEVAQALSNVGQLVTGVSVG